MKLVDQTSAAKLRGGYYTAPPVVDFCIRQARSLVHGGAVHGGGGQGGGGPTSWLEPSAGDGAFLRGLADAYGRGEIAAPRITAVERDADEAAACRAVVEQRQLGAHVEPACFFEWSETSDEVFDAVIGNPPFVRYQFVDERQRASFARQVAALGVPLRGVSNLWIPFALLSLARLRVGGAFALVLPGELLSTVSAGAFRTFLLRDFSALRIDAFPRDTFPELLQDVVVVSGRRVVNLATSRRVTFHEHRPGDELRWSHAVFESAGSWTRYLLTEDELAAFEAARALPGVRALHDVARFEVSIVTGANAFFTIDEATRSSHGLEQWARPLLARTADCPGLVFGANDHHAARERGSRAWLLDFSPERPEPSNGAAAYLAHGEATGLSRRYKCRIREPWYRVPHVRAGALMMTKRAHFHHRLLLNDADALTTDTIYRGEMRTQHLARAPDLVAGFQNTLTLLSTELEGRTYGGGVLELVPTEIARLRVPLVEMAGVLPELDTLSRTSGGQRDREEAVVTAVDERLCERLAGYEDLLPMLQRARARLLARRHRSVHPGNVARSSR